MISKLVRFEARSTFRLLVIVWAALLAISIIMGLVALITGVSLYQDAMHSSSALTVIDKIISALMWVLYVALFVAQIVLTIAIVIVRFYRGMMGEEGYLMHTLPVKTGSLITSKGIIATIAILGSTIIGALSVLILGFSFDPMVILRGLQRIGDYIADYPQLILYIFEGLIVLVLSSVASVYQIYASLAIGQLANRHRILLSLGAYIGISMVFSFISSLLSAIGALMDIEVIVQRIFEHQIIGTQLTFLVLVLATAIPIIIFHVVTEQLLSKRLNLL